MIETHIKDVKEKIILKCILYYILIIVFIILHLLYKNKNIVIE